MTTYTFKDGHKCTSNLNANEVINRMNRLSWLIVLTEPYEDGEGKSICEKAVRAFNKKDNFTGIIKLTALEKDFLNYKLEDNDNEKDIDVINYYLK